MTDSSNSPDRYDTALRLAAVAHDGQKRKGTEIPYLMHPVSVARILERHGYGEWLVLAGLLHDVLEDGKFDQPEWQRPLRTTFRELSEAPADAAGFRDAVCRFILDQLGAETLAAVEAVTQAEVDPARKQAWVEQRKQSLRHLEGMPLEQLPLKAADTTHNAGSIARDVAALGAEALDRFKAAPHETLWYYGSVAGIVGDRLGLETPIVRGLHAAIDDLVSTVDALIRPADHRCVFCGGPTAEACCSGATPPDRSMWLFSGNGQSIYSLRDWRRWAPPAGGDRQWVDGRSAKEAAQAWTQLTPHVDVMNVVTGIPGLENFRVTTVYAELVTQLDNFGEGRNHDVVLLGVADGKKVLVAIEAKNDEEFGPLVGDYLARVNTANDERRRQGNPRLSRVPERIDHLAARIFAAPSPQLHSLRYQLLHGFAGAVIEADRQAADVAVFLVHEFVSSSTDVGRQVRNRRDVDQFLQALGLDHTMLGATGFAGPVGEITPTYIGVVSTELSTEASSSATSGQRASPLGRQGRRPQEDE